MSLFKCKMCGGDLEIVEGASIAECEYCGTAQPVPKAVDENLQNLFNRANALRIKSEFDKAEKIYERIIQADSTQADAYWGLILCKYGIEYVDDPETYEKIPTCHRASYDSIIADDDYKAALANADMSQRILYEKQAHEIDRIQKEILALAQQEESYDVFICYKETDPSGARTHDSVIANDIYYQLTEEGFKVFYAAITLEGKLGSAYEPIIFAALNSAKVMLSIGTKPEYFNAVWVKNEWSRFLKIIKQDHSKVLIPCYRDMDAYELPEEFAHLQAQDMSKIGFINDLIRGIKKVLQKDEPQPVTVVKETVVAGEAATNTAPLLKRAFMFLEDGDWNSANEYCEKVLDIDPENAQAYLGKLMAELEVQKQDMLKDQDETFDDSKNYQKAILFGDEKLREMLIGYIEDIEIRELNAWLEETYAKAKKMMHEANTESAYKEAAHLFESIGDCDFEYLDSAALAKECYKKAKEAKKREEEAKKREEEKKEKCNQLIKEYKAFRNKKEEAKEKHASLKKEYNALIKLKNDWKYMENKLFSLAERSKSVQSEITSCHNERSNLGFFARKRKREIEITIDALQAEQQSLENKITTLEHNIQHKKQGYRTFSEIDNAIDSIHQQGEEQKRIIAFCDTSRAAIRDELSTFELGKKFLQRVTIKRGDYITFGTCKTYVNTEEIEWLVLDVQDRKALIISKYALDCKPYNTSYVNVTWEKCTLRKWLNNDFINAAFSADEKAMIPTVTVSAGKNPNYSTNPGNATQDQVFLLSITEANKYFSSDSARQCNPTDYAVASGASSNGNCWWWLRSPGYDRDNAAYVNDDGFVDEFGYGVFDSNGAVRPALWIDLNA